MACKACVEEKLSVIEMYNKKRGFALQKLNGELPKGMYFTNAGDSSENIKEYILRMEKGIVKIMNEKCPECDKNCEHEFEKWDFLEDCEPFTSTKCIKCGWDVKRKKYYPVLINNNKSENNNNETENTKEDLHPSNT